MDHGLVNQGGREPGRGHVWERRASVVPLPCLPPMCDWGLGGTPEGPKAGCDCPSAGRDSRDSPMRCPTGELNGFPRRNSIVAAAAATNPWNQLTATASASDPSRDTPDGPRGGAGGG